MPREKYQTLTEQMFYILLCLHRECCGTDIMGLVREMTGDRVIIGPGTLYSLLEDFVRQGFIEETRSEGLINSFGISNITDYTICFIQFGPLVACARQIYLRKQQAGLQFTSNVWHTEADLPVYLHGEIIEHRITLDMIYCYSGIKE